MYFVVGIKNIKTNIKTMDRIGEDKSGWIKYYKDKNNEEWEEIVIDDRSFTTLLKKTALPKNIYELMELCFSSKNENDWQGLGQLFSQGKYAYIDIEKFLIKNPNIKKNRRLKFIESFHPIDNRDMVGKHFKDMYSSYEEYKRTIININKLCRK
jgi:hypothetical protein